MSAGTSADGQSAASSHALAGLGVAAANFVAREHRLLIDGKSVPAASGQRLELHDPSTGAVIGSSAAADASDIDLAVRAARAAFEGPWSSFTAAERANVLWRLADLLEANAGTLAEIESIDGGLPIAVSEYMMRVLVPDYCRYYAGWPTKIHGLTIPAAPQGRRPGESLTYTLREPIGVVGAIVPWNAPLLMAVLKLAPALATGCTLVLKPSELTPLTALRLGELCLEAGIPAGVVNVVTGFGDGAGAALAAHPGVDKIGFTGSTETGRRIVRAAAGNLKKVTLELGGKSPVVVLPDADLERAIPGAANAVFFVQGQNCMAGTRLFVHERVHDRVVEGIATYAAALRVGSALERTTDFGPLVSAMQRDRVAAYVEAGHREGGELVCGGAPLDRRGWFYPPTVFARVSPTMKIARDEIFGPVLAVQTFGDDDLDAVVRAANGTTYGLSGSVWTRDLSLAHRLVRRIDAGQVSVNTHGAIDSAIPFGGNKQSGWGREFGQEGLEPYLKTKAVTVAF